MPGSALALVLMAAVLHAGWNALAKRGEDQFRFLWLATALASLLFLPATLAPLVRDGLPPAALPFVIATSVLHALYFYALGRSYRSGGFSVVYPVARGLGVALVPVLAVPLLGEHLSPLGAAGVALVVVGIVGLHLASRGLGEVAQHLTRAGAETWWAVLTGLTIAAYALVDKAGVARLHPVPYIGLMFVGSSALLAPVALATPGALRREWTTHRRALLGASVMALAAYLLVLFAFRLSKTGYVVAAREVSIVLSALIGSLWLREGALTPRLVGAGVVLAGVACVALAR